MTAPTGSVRIGVSADASDLPDQITRAVQAAMTDALRELRQGITRMESALGTIDASGLGVIQAAAREASSGLNEAGNAAEGASTSINQVSQSAQDAVNRLGNTSRAAQLLGQATSGIGSDAARAAAELNQLGNAGRDAARGLDQAADAADEAGDAADQAGQGAEQAGFDFAEMGKQAGIAALAVVGIGGAMDTVAQAIEQADLRSKLQAQLNLTEEESEKAGRIAGNLYAGAYGESMQEVNDAVGAVVSSLGNLTDTSEAEVQKLTEHALNLASAYGIDVAEATQTVNSLIRQGIAEDGTQAFDLLVASMQGVPAQMRGELLPIIDEYGDELVAIGLTGEEAMGLIVNAAQDGAIGIDKAGDAIKEFTLLATDISNTGAQDALKGMGFDAEEMSRRLLAGGETAKTAFFEIVNGLKGIDDPAEQARAAIALFGTPLEDIGVTEIPQFLTGLSNTGSALGDVTGRAEQFGQQLNSGPGVALETFKRTLQQGVIEALTNFGQLLWDNRDAIKEVAIALAPIGIALTGLVGYITAVKVATLAAAAATKLWSTLFLNTPIGRIIALITLLVSGVIYAYRNFEGFRNVVQGAWKGIQDAASFAWNSILKPTFEALSSAVQAVGSFFVDLWQNWVKPAFEGIASLASWLWNNVLSPIWTGIRIGIAVVAVAFQLAWEAIKVVFDLWGIAMNFLWSTFISPVFDLIKGGIALVGDAFSWVWNNVISPTWQALGAGIDWVWQNIVRPSWEALKAGLQAVGDFFVWVNNTLVQPTWQALGAGIDWVWQNIVRPVWEALKAGLQSVGDFFTMIWNNVISPVWTALGNGIDAVWTSVVSPVFEALKTGVDLVGQAFDKATSWIGRVWDTLKAKAAVPVKFVIQKVYNEGIVQAWNKVSGWLGLEGLQEYNPEWMGEYARGTSQVLPGYTPGRDVHRFISTDGRLGLNLSGGEAIMVPEWTRAMGGPSWVDRMNHAARYGGRKAVMETLHEASYAGGGVVNGFQLTDEQWRMWSAFQPHNQSAVVTDAGYRNWDDGTGGRSYHYSGEALDIAGPDMMGYAQWIRANDPDARELFYDPLGGFVNGQSIGPIGGHGDHVHWTAGGDIGDGKGGFVAALSGFVGRVVRKLRETVASAFDAVMDPIGDRIPEFPGVIGTFPRGAFDYMRKTVRDWLVGKADEKDQQSSYTGWSGGGVEQWRPNVEMLLAHYGQSAGLVGSVLRRMNQESGGDPNAVNQWDVNWQNGTPSVGLMQVIGPTYDANKDPLFDKPPYMYGVSVDPDANISASMRYALRQYGSLSAAYDRAGGYDQGGLAVGSGMLPKYTVEPERVLSPRQTVAFEDLVHVLTGTRNRGQSPGVDYLEDIRNATVNGLLPLTLQETGDIVEVKSAVAEVAENTGALNQALGEGLVADTSSLFAGRSQSSHEAVRAAQEAWIKEQLERFRPELERLQKEVLEPAFNAGKGVFERGGTPEEVIRAALDTLTTNGRQFGEEAGDAIVQKIRETRAFPFDGGGVATGTGFLAKNVVAPERVLSPRQTVAFEAMLPLFERIAAASVSLPSNLSQQARTIDNRRYEIHSPVNLHGVQDYRSFQDRDSRYLLSKLSST